MYPKSLFAAILSASIFTLSCASKNNVKITDEGYSYETYQNPIMPLGSEPWATFHNGTYYYTHGCVNKIVLWSSTDITKLDPESGKTVWLPKEESNAHNLWGPEMHRLNDKWYIYFTADNGNTDNHQIYVIENPSENPLEGEFVMKGRIKTDPKNNWAIHANVFQHNGKLYMAWSGWQTARVDAETQCIYIAEMENPWTLKSDRIMISTPDMEWERQWVNPDGTRTSYPIFVNESPQFLLSKNKDKVIIFYNASGNWTPYYATGMLIADADSDLLDSASWTKSKEPSFSQNKEDNVYATGSLAFIPSPDGSETYFIYHARDIENEVTGSLDSRSPRMQKVEWDENGIPILGKPIPRSQKLRKPAGS